MVVVLFRLVLLFLVRNRVSAEAESRQTVLAAIALCDGSSKIGGAVKTVAAVAAPSASFRAWFFTALVKEVVSLRVFIRQIPSVRDRIGENGLISYASKLLEIQKLILRKTFETSSESRFVQYNAIPLGS
ncbi:hypothetical protein ASE36_21430 [Rhizobium sp. Root274]|uniref:hypothetical protein n=1 Tax=unclassified Rhizobium TaxID=2613769 RepID=UPI000712FB0E|nr:MULTISPECIES: hypothetical protein [unclassified Rhizobium]KQW24225.1 hypothetical protein ASC71_21490 [Rhizobium sp. Root1240]KRD25416.1 hypothetical protein ASE36_21430 [Rhizobium sp. Root274]